MTEDERVLAAWLCNECYGKYFIAGFKHGVTSETKVSSTRSTQITTMIGSTPIVLTNRNFAKSSNYKHEFFDPHGIAPRGPIDTNYVSYWSDIGKGCWGAVTNVDIGSYSTFSEYANSVIYFADLRNDILVYSHETGSSSGSASGSGPIGQALAYAGFEGGESSCKEINVLDSIMMPLAITSLLNANEIITLGGHVPYSFTRNDANTLNIAASDRSGLCGGVSYECYAWGGYSVIDQDKDYNCDTGEYVELVRPDRLEDYFNEWDSFGTNRSIDDYDQSIWDGSFNGIGVNNIPNGTISYPSFINIDPMPRGGWCVDAEGNTFFSQITAESSVYNRLNQEDLATITGMPDHTNVVFYPLAPV